MITLPYNKAELLTAFIGLQKTISIKKLKKAFAEIESELDAKLSNDETTAMELIAKHNSISVEMLVNSPNLQVLQTQYKDLMYKSVVDGLEKKLGISQKEAWSILASALELLDGPLT